MSHENVATQVGTCDTCGRKGVELHLSRHRNPRTGKRQLNCVDEFACFEHWLETRVGIRVSKP